MRSGLLRRGVALLFVLLTGLTALAGTVSYLPSDAILTNPERGFYKHTERHSGDTTPLDIAELLAYRAEGFSLVLRLFYLEDFVDAPIGNEYLALIQDDFDTIRLAGLKAIVRFAYTDVLPPSPPWGDATKIRVLAHLDQLEPILQSNGGVIAVVQTGFVGVWGEWYYTDHFVADPSAPGNVTPSDYTDRRDVLFRLLDALPDTRMVQLRTPNFKQQIFETTEPLTAEQAFDASDIARTGHHNDCFLASDTDYGTYVDDQETEYPYLSSDTAYTPMGGETCSPNPPRSDCETATHELALFHWSYLNAGYHPDVLAGWVTGGCMADIERSLGYRLALVQGTFSNEVRPGHRIDVQLVVENVGYAPPYNPRLVQLLLRHEISGDLHAVILPDDPRFWTAGAPGGHDVAASVCVPSDLPEGGYELLLNLPDPATGLRGRPEYSIHVANEGDVRELATGYNRLEHALIVSGAAPPTPCATHLSFKAWNAPPGEVTDFRWETKSEAAWGVEPAAARYHVYRSDLDQVSTQAYTCRDDLDLDRTDRVLLDADEPAPGGGFVYLITSENPAGAEGTPGQASDGERANTDSCLTP